MLHMTQYDIGALCKRSVVCSVYLRSFVQQQVVIIHYHQLIVQVRKGVVAVINVRQIKRAKIVTAVLNA